jgi:hypothetical protein
LIYFILAHLDHCRLIKNCLHKINALIIFFQNTLKLERNDQPEAMVPVCSLEVPRTAPSLFIQGTEPMGLLRVDYVVGSNNGAGELLKQ